MSHSDPALIRFLPHLLALLVAVAAALAAGHIVLTKRDVRAAIGWLGLVLVFPLAGPLLYGVFGVNRLQRRATALRPATRQRRRLAPPPSRPPRFGHLATLETLVGEVVCRPLTFGNGVVPLVDGEQAYPAMLAAIDGARHSVALSTYIFDNDGVGRRFLAALAAAVARGVEVRVIVDAVGARYSFPPIPAALRAAGVPAAVFLPTRIPWRLAYLNLRTHRKVLVADGRRGFVGGLNLRDEHLVAGGSAHPVQDLHFQMEGPVVGQIQTLFAADWELVAGERLAGDAWFPDLALPAAREVPRSATTPKVISRPDDASAELAAGEAAARVIPDGPDDDLDKLRWVLLGALATACHSVRIVTPYFLPDQDLVTALGVAALRGVEVDVLLPEKNNLTLVAWAATAQLDQVLEHGCRVWMTSPPFDHTKLMLVDDAWALVGSFNWDPRSLRLNFEIGVEVYDERLCAELDALVEHKLATARRVTRESLAARSLAVRLRDGIAWLAQPYL